MALKCSFCRGVLSQDRESILNEEIDSSIPLRDQIEITNHALNDQRAALEQLRQQLTISEALCDRYRIKLQRLSDASKLVESQYDHLPSGRDVECPAQQEISHSAYAETDEEAPASDVPVSPVGNRGSKILTHGWVSNKNVKAFVDSYCHRRANKDGIELMNITSAGDGRWEAVITIGDRVLARGVGRDGRSARKRCYKNACNSLRASDPEEWTDFLRKTQAESQIPPSGSVEAPLEPIPPVTFARANALLQRATLSRKCAKTFVIQYCTGRSVGRVQMRPSRVNGSKGKMWQASTIFEGQDFCAEGRSKTDAEDGCWLLIGTSLRHTNWAVWEEFVQSPQGMRYY